VSIYHEGMKARGWSYDRCSNPYEGAEYYLFFATERKKSRERDRDEWYRGWDAKDFEERQKYPALFRDKLSVVPPKS